MKERFEYVLEVIRDDAEFTLYFAEGGSAATQHRF
jgi:hypothetical protein